MLLIAGFVGLAAIWGASFIFLKVAAPEFGPFLSAEMRVGIAWIFLTICSWWISKTSAGTATQRQFFVLGLFNSALPFALYGLSALVLPAGYLAIFNAIVPLWGALIATVFAGHQLRFQLVCAVVLAMMGISLLVNLGPVPVEVKTFLAALACLLATLCYAIGAHLSKLWMSSVSLWTVSRSTLGYASLALLPIAALDLPSAQPTALGWASILALGILSSALAYLLYFWLLKQIGPVRVSTVTFLIPAFGVLWGVIFLGEPLTFHVLLGLALVVSASLMIHRTS